MDRHPIDFLHPRYWEAQYQLLRQGWDMGYASPPIKTYLDQLRDKSLQVLVPGAGKGWEVKYLFDQGFKNTFYLDFSAEAVAKFKTICPDFPANQILNSDFFSHHRQYDLILEQTFLSSFPKERWEAVAEKINKLLNPGGKYVGLLFNHDFGHSQPPFASHPETYRSLFKPFFRFKTFETATNSIKPRAGREIFFILQKN
ncbi:MAG: methyltransferase domain-containing protein [Bacteroidales bacterium]|nr:methyltransferase domain-containing protein [Bacteroidales bacterium]